MQVPEPEDILAEYLAEHAYWSDFDPTTQTLSIQFGIPELVPELPEHVTDDTMSVCALCNTEVTNRPEVGWVHETGFRARGGCSTPWPR